MKPKGYGAGASARVKFLADENIEQPVVDFLRSCGHDVSYVGDTIPGARDEDVLRIANSESRVVLTSDKDFGELAYRENRASAGIVLLRLHTQDGVEKAARLVNILPSVEARLSGHFAVITDRSVRLRPLRKRG